VKAIFSAPSNYDRQRQPLAEFTQLYENGNNVQETQYRTLKVLPSGAGKKILLADFW
jgi:hypothetical protein